MQTVAMVITWNHCDFSKNIFEEHVTLLTLKKSGLYQIKKQTNRFIFPNFHVCVSYQPFGYWLLEKFTYTYENHMKDTNDSYIAWGTGLN